MIRVLQPLPEVYPCALVPLPPEITGSILPKISPGDALRAARAFDDGSWLLSYDGKDFKTFINPKPPPEPELQRGAFIGGMKALVKFAIIDKGQCFGGVRSFDDGFYLIWMAHGGVILGRMPMNGIPLTGAGGRTFEVKWFMALVRPSPDGKITIEALIFYPDDTYRSPEEMLKAARSLDDGGLLKPLPPGADN